jgi:DNA-binding XRE family transcriptional regulator
MDPFVEQSDASTRRAPGHLAQLRFLKGFTSQLAFARATGLGRTTIVRLENGSTPRLATAAKIAHLLGTTIEAIWPELLDQAGDDQEAPGG